MHPYFRSAHWWDERESNSACHLEVKVGKIGEYFILVEVDWSLSELTCFFPEILNPSLEQPQLLLTTAIAHTSKWPVGHILTLAKENPDNKVFYMAIISMTADLVLLSHKCWNNTLPCISKCASNVIHNALQRLLAGTDYINREDKWREFFPRCTNSWTLWSKRSFLSKTYLFWSK